MPSRRLLRALSVLLALVTAPGCDLLPTMVDAPPGLRPFIVRTTDKNIFPNAVQYANNSLPNSSSTKDGVTVTARALLAANGATDLVVTTGDMGNLTAAPGEITKVQVKAFYASDRKSPRWVENFNDLSGSGSFHTTLANAHRGMVFELQVHVTGVGSNANKTYVVDLEEAVKAAPDLRASIVPSSEAHPGVATPITATVLEGRGDVGATADCLLRVGGQVVDRADNIWVDAGDRVSCAFMYTFPQSGDYEVSVEASNVRPGDYDLGNNISSGHVVVKPTTASEFHLAAGLAGDVYAYDFAYEYGAVRGDEGTAPYSYRDTYYEQSVSGWFYGPTADMGQVAEMTYDEYTDGRKIFSRSVSNVNSIDEDGFFIFTYLQGENPNVWYGRFSQGAVYRSLNLAELTKKPFDSYAWVEYAGWSNGPERGIWGSDVLPKLTITDVSGKKIEVGGVLNFEKDGYTFEDSTDDDCSSDGYVCLERSYLMYRYGGKSYVGG